MTNASNLDYDNPEISQDSQLSSLDQNQMTEEEASLYDRQIRLWGVEAQNRMKMSSVLMINLGGVASEACKNIVLAGVGSISILDTELVSPQDLACGFFFREEDIGSKRVDAAVRRINSLNPRVKVTGLSGGELGAEDLPEEGFLKSFDVVCLTDSSAPRIIRINEICRRAKKPLFAAASLGISGYIFADLIDHTFIQENVIRLANDEVKKTTERRTQSFLPLHLSMKSTLNHVTEKRIKKVSPLLWCCLTLFEYQIKYSNDTQDTLESDKLIEICREILKERGIDESLLPTNLLRQLSKTIKAEFVPTCAIIGSILSQEVLNLLGGQKSPLANLFVFDGQRSAGDIYALGIQRTT